MLTVAEAAVHARVCASIIRKWVSSGFVPHYRLGARGKRGKIMIDVSDLDEAIASLKVGRKVPEPTQAPASKHLFKHLKMN